MWAACRVWVVLVCGAATAAAQTDECADPAIANKCPRPQICGDTDLEKPGTWQCACPPRQSGWGDRRAAAECLTMAVGADLDECKLCGRNMGHSPDERIEGPLLRRFTGLSRVDCAEQCVATGECMALTYYERFDRNFNGCREGESCCDLLSDASGDKVSEMGAFSMILSSLYDITDCHKTSADDIGKCARDGEQTCVDPKLGTRSLSDWECRCVSDPDVRAIRRPVQTECPEPLPTPAPATPLPMTSAPPTPVPPTPTPPTSSPATQSPSTPAPATDVPVTDAPTTAMPATNTPATDTPSTNTPPTDAPATDTPLTNAPATDVPATDTPSTNTPPTDAPATDTPLTNAPATDVPATDTPSTNTPPTDAPATDTPLTNAPATDVPATDTPSTNTPPTDAPATDTPLTNAPATDVPATDTPSTNTPATNAPATGMPGTAVPATGAPDTAAPPTPTTPTVAPTAATLAPLATLRPTALPASFAPLAVSRAPAGYGTAAPPTSPPASTGVPRRQNTAATDAPLGVQATGVPVVAATAAPSSALSLVPPEGGSTRAPAGAGGTDGSGGSPDEPAVITGAAKDAGDTIASVTTAGTATILAASVAGSPGPAGRLMAVAVMCEPNNPIPTGRYSLAMAPLQLEIAGSRALGTIVGNTVLAAGAMVVGWVLCVLIGGFVKRYFPSVNAVDAQAMVMFPSAPLAMFLMLYQGTSLAGMDLVLNPVGGTLMIAGLVGACVCVAIPGVIYQSVTAGVPREAYVRHKHERSCAHRFLFDGGEWVSRTRAAHFARRWGPVLRPFRCETAWYAVVEFAASFLISAAQAVNPTTLRGCGHIKACAALVFAVLLGMEVYLWPHLHQRNSMFDVMSLGGQMAAMATFAVAYYQDDMDSMWFTAGAFMLVYCVAVLAVRSIVDVVGMVTGVVKGRRRKLQEAAFAESDTDARAEVGIVSEMAAHEKSCRVGSGTFFVTHETATTDEGTPRCWQPPQQSSPRSDSECLTPRLSMTPPPPSPHRQRSNARLHPRSTPGWEGAVDVPPEHTGGVASRRRGASDVWPTFASAAGSSPALLRDPPRMSAAVEGSAEDLTLLSPRGRWRRGLAGVGRPGLARGGSGADGGTFSSGSFSRDAALAQTSSRSMPNTPASRCITPPRNISVTQPVPSQGPLRVLAPSQLITNSHVVPPTPTALPRQRSAAYAV